MLRILTTLFVVVSLTGCVTPMAFQEQLPDVAYTINEGVLVSVIDERIRVKEGKPKDFIGKAHGAFGIPSDWHVKQVLATEEGDKERDLSEWLQHRIVKGLEQKGFRSASVELEDIPSFEEAKSVLIDNDASWLFVMVLNEWYFSINLHWVSAFNFDTDTDVHVFDAFTGELLSKRFKERDVIEEKATESPQNLIMAAYKAQLQQIINDEEIRLIMGK
ncbi:MAG: hypothetical protein KQI78_12290 [Deltaproteobacteria bacterium]|nr:hypothetical protein [Deltaproteobacteria bacterium]